jgi:hypothetical protein
MQNDPKNRELMQPDVPQVDIWEDAACLEEMSTRPLLALPAKQVPRAHKERVLAPADSPLRIESWSLPSEENADLQPPGLEIVKINDHVLRLAPELPAVERVPRKTTFRPRQADSAEDDDRLSGESAKWGIPQSHSLWWLYGAGAAIIFMVVGAMAMLPRVNRANTIQVRPGQLELVIDPVDADDLQHRVNAMSERQSEAQALFDAYANARTVDQVLPLLRDPATVKPLLHATGWDRLVPRERTANAWAAHAENGLVYGMLTGALSDHSRFLIYCVDQGGALRIDWKASTGHGTAAFPILADGIGDPSEIRGWIAPADFYTHMFPESDYRAYRLLSPDEQVALWVFAAADGKAAAELDPLFRGGHILGGNKQARKVTLRLAPPPEGAMPNHWLLVELLHKGWIRP